MSEYVLRDATTEDVTAVLEIERLSFSDPWTEGMLVSALDDGFDFTVLLYENTPIGYSILDRRVQGEAELHNIAITPAFRGKGASRLLMDKLIEDAKQHGAENVFLEVRANNTAAKELYKKYGFLPFKMTVVVPSFVKAISLNSCKCGGITQFSCGLLL